MYPAMNSPVSIRAHHSWTPTRSPLTSNRWADCADPGEGWRTAACCEADHPGSSSSNRWQ